MDNLMSNSKVSFNTIINVIIYADFNFVKNIPFGLFAKIFYVFFKLSLYMFYTK